MASEKQIAANRMNAKKSRGPRSAGGKARASRNATRHGLAANFWNDPSAGYAIETMTKLFRKTGYPEQKARLAAVLSMKQGLCLRRGARSPKRSALLRMVAPADQSRMGCGSCRASTVTKSGHPLARRECFDKY